MPATAVSLSDSGPPAGVIGENQPLQHSITLTATGLPASRLPELAPASNQAFQVRVDSVELDEEITEQGLVSRRVEHLSLVPRRTGELSFPRWISPGGTWAKTGHAMPACPNGCWRYRPT
ncbi:hypothetical protein [Marinobacterium aestuariivivens]|uniref:Uncharacterized protein n=1 Tax=Marinobacterium aestuariivivens TaxID=1698799 RepID=A0ABW1ZSW5_9GAMM